MSSSPCEGSGTASFHRRDGALHCEQIAVEELADRFGTPLYIYSAATIRERIAGIRSAFGADAKICYATKANSNLSILRLVHEAGCGFDLVSGGELERLHAAGVPTDQSVFAGVAKQTWEIERAVRAGILFFNVESPHELPLLSAAGKAADCVVQVALRLNPDVDAGVHAYISTGKHDNKFGIALPNAGALVDEIAADPFLQLVGYHVHLGSQLQSIDPYTEACDRVLAFVDGAANRQDGVRYYDLGGGFGISYGQGDKLDVAAVAAALLPRLQSRSWSPVVEPGRFLVGDAGVLVASVLDTKQQGKTAFLLCDAAMNDLLRPALYQAEHPIVPVRTRDDAEDIVVDVVGPVCETGDFLGKARTLPKLAAGERLAVLAAGAYGASIPRQHGCGCSPFFVASPLRELLQWISNLLPLPRTIIQKWLPCWVFGWELPRPE